MTVRALTAAALLALLAAGTQAAEAGGVGCDGARGARLVTASSSVAVVRARRGDFLGCRRGRSAVRLTSLVDAELDDTMVSTFQIAGDWISWAETWSDRDGAVATVRSCNVRSRRGAYAQLGPEPTTPRVGALGVTRDGSLAWTTYDRGVGPQANAVHVADAAGTRQVAAGPGVDVGSLAVSRRRAYWTDGDQPLSVPLQGTNAKRFSGVTRRCPRALPG